MIAFRLVQPPPVWAETVVVTGALPTRFGAFILAGIHGSETDPTSGAALFLATVSFATLSVALALMG